MSYGHTNKHPRTGLPDPDRIVSADGKRSIRYGSHEVNSKPTKHHYHEETWTLDPRNNVMNVDNTVVRVPLPRSNMNIKILEVEHSKNIKKVKFKTSIGIGVGVWEGQLPTKGTSIDIEIDIDDIFDWGENINTTNLNESIITIDGNLFNFVAEVISYETDSCLIVKLNKSIVLLDVENAPNNIQGWIEVKTENLKLYPTNL